MLHKMCRMLFWFRCYPGILFEQEFDGTLDCVSLAVTCSFNRRGTLIAVGCNDGRIVIWDFLTRGIAKIMASDSNNLRKPSFKYDKTPKRGIRAYFFRLDP